jgi:hypothetical protein
MKTKIKLKGKNFYSKLSKFNRASIRSGRGGKVISMQLILEIQWKNFNSDL